jgi:hypothetical protein
VLGQEFVSALNEVSERGGSKRPSIYDIHPHWRE